VRNESTPARLNLNITKRLQYANRLAQAGTADTQHFAQFRFRWKPVAYGIFTGLDHFPYGIYNGIRYGDFLDFFHGRFFFLTAREGRAAPEPIRC
jgi:hypothetical protein